MPDTGVYIVVVGHNLDAKCDVANALANQRQLFRPFSCRTKYVVKSRITVIGHQLFIVATPDLNTPSWTHIEKDLRKFQTKVFLYVQDDDCIDSDDSGSIEMLQNRFSEKSKKVKVLVVQYNTKTTGRGDHNSFRSSDSSEPSDSFTKLTASVEDQIIINKTDKFEDKCGNAGKIMKLLKGSLKKPTTKNESAIIVDDRKQNVEKSMTEPSDGNVLETEASILDSVKISEDIDHNVDGEAEFRNIPLPALDNDDWTLYANTLRKGTARSNHVRVNIVGNQGAGKTSLVKRLQEIDIKCPDEFQKPTEGIEINQVTSRCVEIEGVRYWKIKPGGYEHELNLQRMAFAFHNTKHCVNEEANTKQELVSDQMDDEFARGSDEMVEDSDDYAFELRKRADIKEKELYLRKVKRWKDYSTEERMYVSYWDFAGQSTYYSTHQAFMAPAAVYVLVIDLSKGLHEKLSDSLKFRTGILKQYTVEETVKFWISSIKAYTRDEENGHSPFIIVGTHRDKVTEEEVREKFNHLRKVLKTLTHVEFVAIDNTCLTSADTHLINLRNKILDLGLGVIDEEIPAQWINLEYTILQRKNDGKDFLSYSDIQELDQKSDMPMRHQALLEAFLEHEHRRGWLMHFCHVELKDIIILDPALLAGYLNILLREQPGYEFPSSGLAEDGRVPQAFLQEVAAKVFNVTRSDNVIDTILKILIHLHIMYHYEEDVYFLPCLLPHKEDREKMININHYEKAPTLRLSFADAFVPPAFFHLLIAALNEEHDLTIYKKNEIPRVYNLFACFCFKRSTLWLEVYWHQCCLLFDLRNFSENISELKSSKILVKTIKIVKNKIEHTLSVYRQDYVKYLLEIECAKHPGKFVDLKEVREKGEVMCSDGNEIHSVSWDSVNHFLPRGQTSCHDGLRRYETRASDKALGRLSKTPLT